MDSGAKWLYARYDPEPSYSKSVSRLKLARAPVYLIGAVIRLMKADDRGPPVLARGLLGAMVQRRFDGRMRGFRLDDPRPYFLAGVR